MGLSQRQKGIRREREVVLALKAEGHADARRVPLSGALAATLGPEYGGDVTVAGLRLEIKARADLPLTLERWLGKNDGLILIGDRKPWRIYLGWDQFLQLAGVKQNESNSNSNNGSTETS